MLYNNCNFLDLSGTKHFGLNRTASLKRIAEIVRISSVASAVRTQLVADRKAPTPPKTGSDARLSAAALA